MELLALTAGIDIIGMTRKDQTDGRTAGHTDGRMGQPDNIMPSLALRLRHKYILYTYAHDLFTVRNYQQ